MDYTGSLETAIVSGKISWYSVRAILLPSHKLVFLEIVSCVIICDWLWEKGHIRANNEFSV